MLRRPVASRVCTFSLVACQLALLCGTNLRCFAEGAAAPPSQSASATEKDTTVFGFKLHYREAGKGPAVILLHGLGGDGSRWTSTMDILSGECRVIALDQIGFGESDKPLANYNHELLAEFLVEFIQSIDVEKASLVGHSMGAFVAMFAAVQSPDLIDRLVLVDGGSLVARPRSEHLLTIQNGTTLAETREYFELMFYDKSYVTDAMVRANYARRLRVAYTITKMQEARENGRWAMSEEQARTIAAPTLILWGKHDGLLDPADAAMLDRVIPNSRVELLQKTGHIPQIEEPQRFNQLVHDFVTAKDGSDAGQ